MYVDLKTIVSEKRAIIYYVMYVLPTFAAEPVQMLHFGKILKQDP